MSSIAQLINFPWILFNRLYCVVFALYNPKIPSKRQKKKKYFHNQFRNYDEKITLSGSYEKISIF